MQMAVQRAPALRQYIWDRFWRIYPPYIASFVLILIMIFSRKITSGTNDFIPLPQGAGGWIANILVATRPVTRYAAVNWVYWSLAYEIAFYTVLGICVCIKSLKYPLLIGVSIIAIVVGRHAAGGLFFLNCWSFFALGVALAEWRFKPGPLPILIVALCALDFIWRQPLPRALAAVAAVLACWACMVPAGAWLNREKFFRFIGQWSYSLYLTHVPIACWVACRFATGYLGQDVRQRGLVEHLAMDVACTLVACLGAWLFFIFVERPSMAIMRVKIPSLFERRLARHIEVGLT